MRRLAWQDERQNMLQNLGQYGNQLAANTEKQQTCLCWSEQKRK